MAVAHVRPSRNLLPVCRVLPCVSPLSRLSACSGTERLSRPAARGAPDVLRVRRAPPRCIHGGRNASSNHFAAARTIACTRLYSWACSVPCARCIRVPRTLLMGARASAPRLDDWHARIQAFPSHLREGHPAQPAAASGFLWATPCVPHQCTASYLGRLWSEGASESVARVHC